MFAGYKELSIIPRDTKLHTVRWLAKSAETAGIFRWS